MRDQIESRMWLDHHHAFSESVAGIFRSAGAAFKRLHALQWDAPWRPTDTSGA